MKSKMFSPLTSLVMAAALAIGLAGCGGGSSSSKAPVEEPPTAYEQAVMDIAAATTAAAAQAAYDAVKDDVTAAQGAKLQAAVDARKETLAMMGRAGDQKKALMAAADAIDTSELETQDAIDAAQRAIDALKAAIAAAVDVDDTSMYDAQVTTAETAVATAQSALDHDAQTAELTSAVEALQAIDLTGLSTQEKVDAAEAAVDALRAALDAATELSDDEKAVAMAELATASRTVMAAQGRVDTGSQKMVLADAHNALKAIDLDDLMTQEDIDTLDRAIIELDLALKAATHLTDADKLDATVDVTVAKRRMMAAQETLTASLDSQKDALMKAGAALAAIDLKDLDTAEKITAANTAVEALKAALGAATHLSDDEKAMYQTQLDTATETVKTAQTGMDRDGRIMAQKDGLTNASTALESATEALSGTPTQEQIDAAQAALDALNTAIEEADELTDAEKASAQLAAATAKGQIDGAKKALMARMDAEDKAKEDEAKRAAVAMAATAAKLYTGISAQMGAGDGTTFAATDRDAYYNTDATAILVSIGDGTNVPTAVSATLSEDKKTTVAKNHGWAGKRYADPAGGDMYEARVYSNVAAPKQGRKFGSAAAVTPTGAFEYQLTDGALPSASFEAKNVAFSGVTQTAGRKSFDLPDPNPSSADIILIPGSYHGVSGTYSCTPAVAADGCSADVAGVGGFTVSAGDTWTFKPSNANARVLDAADTDYASYGWWIKKVARDGDFTASAFVDEKGAVAAASGLNDLNGTATYQGGAAGKYALASSTGGTNDAGHFTARATLEANFTTNAAETAITGTIDQFMGADGESRDWSVKLNGSQIGDTGGIGNASDSTGVDTVWTIDGTAAVKSGNWTGTLRNNGTDLIPQVATGTFYTEYGTAGKMVGAFGANKQ